MCLRIAGTTSSYIPAIRMHALIIHADFRDYMDKFSKEFLTVRKF